MKAPGASWDQFSKAAGLSKDTVARLLRTYSKSGDILGGDPRTLEKLAKHYKVRPAWLIAGDGDPHGEDALERVIAKSSNTRRYTELVLSLARTIRDSEPERERSVEEWQRVLSLLLRAVQPDEELANEEPKRSTIRKV